MWRIDPVQQYVNMRWRLPGEVASMAYSVINCTEYIYMTFTGVSLVTYTPVDPAACGLAMFNGYGLRICSDVQILAGNHEPGKMDGLRDDARFQTQLLILKCIVS